MRLAQELKVQVDRLLDPRNQHTVSLEALKEPDKNKQAVLASPTMLSAEKLEIASYLVRHQKQ